MAKLTRVPAKVFAASAAADEIGQFGSAVAGSKLETADVATIQGLSAWLSGWSEALVSGNRYPSLQEMNGLLKVLSYQGAYTLQEGIPEYDSATTYYIGSIIKKTGTSELYKSIVNDNVGNVLTDDTKWLFLGDLSYLTKSIILVGTCSTAAATAEKEITLDGYVEYTGAQVQLTFSNSNTASNPTLNFNAGTARALKDVMGNALTYIPANTKLNVFFDGTNYICTNATALLLSLSASGYVKLPSGLILQWGLATVTSNTTVNFPVAFPSNCLQVVASHDTGSNRVETYYGCGPLTASSFKCANSKDSGAQSCRWIAIGY